MLFSFYERIRIHIDKTVLGFINSFRKIFSVQTPILNLVIIRFLQILLTEINELILFFEIQNSNNHNIGNN